nr:hypothetical protein [Tanacetum cinerariifolium]
SMNYKPVVAWNQPNGNACTKEIFDAGQAGKKTVPDQEYIRLPLWTQDSLMSPDDGFKPSGEEVKEDNVVDEDIVYGCTDDPKMPPLEEISIFKDSREAVFGVEADYTNLESTYQVSPIPTTRVHKDHLVEQIIRDLYSTPQTRRMTKNVTDHGMIALTDPAWVEAMQEELLQFKLQKV